MVLPGHGDVAMVEPLYLPGFASLAERTLRNASGNSEAGTAQSEYAMTWTAGFTFQETVVRGIWLQIRPNRAFKLLQTSETVFDSGLFLTALRYSNCFLLHCTRGNEDG